MENKTKNETKFLLKYIILKSNYFPIFSVFMQQGDYHFILVAYALGSKLSLCEYV